MDSSIMGAASGSRPASASLSRTDSTSAPASREAGSDTTRSGASGSGLAPVTVPKPLRFPWLSRLSEQLGAVAKQKTPFASAQVLGDNLDKSV